jgi:hypothetical protein
MSISVQKAYENFRQNKNFYEKYNWSKNFRKNEQFCKLQSSTVNDFLRKLSRKLLQNLKFCEKLFFLLNFFDIVLWMFLRQNSRTRTFSQKVAYCRLLFAFHFDMTNSLSVHFFKTLLILYTD